MTLTTSYVHGASGEPLVYQTIGEALDEAAERWPGNEALVSCHQNLRWTYAELKERADGFAAGLVALGLKPGERIGIWSPNCAEWLLTQFATAKAGLILVNINPAYRLSELEYALNKVAGVKVKIGALAHISADHFREHFEHAARGTTAENARLEIECASDASDPQAQEIILQSVEVDE